MASKTYQLALECKRQSESCLYASTTLYVWLRFLRAVKVTYIVGCLTLGSFAGWEAMTASHDADIAWIVAACAFLAGLLPTIYSALKFDEHLEQCRSLSGEFKNLQDRFRQAATISARKPFAQFESEVEPLIERLERARNVSLTPPEWCFRRAQKKISAGDYSFEVDVIEDET